MLLQSLIVFEGFVSEFELIFSWAQWICGMPPFVACPERFVLQPYGSMASSLHLNLGVTELINETVPSQVRRFRSTAIDALTLSRSENRRSDKGPCIVSVSSSDALVISRRAPYHKANLLSLMLRELAPNVGGSESRFSKF
jgi:hypothetical protein